MKTKLLAWRKASGRAAPKRFGRRRAIALAAGLAIAPFAGAVYAKQYSAQELADRAVQRRAVEAANWGMPVVNYDRMFQAFAQVGGGDNQIVYWTQPPDWKVQVLTPNTDTIYFMPFINTHETAPMVLEIPAAGSGTIVGSIMDAWQMALEDVGPAGADAGKGGKYLLLPPGYEGAPPAGYIVLPSGTYRSYALLRSVPKSGGAADIAAAVAYAKSIKLYPLSAAANPSATKFVDATGRLFDATIPYDLRFFESLDRIVQAEPWLGRDRAMIDLLKSVGIEQGKPFKPDAKTAAILESALAEARAWFDLRYDSFTPFFPGHRWFFPVDMSVPKATVASFNTPDAYPVDGRGLVYYWGFSSIKRVGGGQMNQIYLMTDVDQEGRALALTAFTCRRTHRRNNTGPSPLMIVRPTPSFARWPAPVDPH